MADSKEDRSWDVYGMKGKKIVHKFTIENFLKEVSEAEVGSSISSRRFEVHCGGMYNDLLFTIRVYPKGLKEDNGCISIFISNESQVEVDVSYEFYMETATGGKIGARSSNGKKRLKRCSVDGKFQGFANFHSRQTLKNVAEEKSAILPDGSLTVVSHVAIFFSKGTEEGTLTEYMFEGGASLIEGLKSSLRDSTLTDLKINCQGRVFSCHKIILASRSDVLKTMVTNEAFQEARNGEITVTDMEASTLELFLQFLYSDCVSEDALREHWPSLLNAAEKYNIIRLRNLCEKHMRENIALGNAAEFLVLAHLRNLGQLKNAAMNYVIRQLPKIKARSSDWQMIKDHPDLVADLYIAKECD